MRAVFSLALLVVSFTVAGCGDKKSDSGSTKKDPASSGGASSSSDARGGGSSGAPVKAGDAKSSATKAPKGERVSIGDVSAVFPKAPKPDTKQLGDVGKLRTLAIEGDDGNFYSLSITELGQPFDADKVLATLKGSAFASVQDKTVTDKAFTKFGLPGMEIGFTKNAANTRPLGGVKRTLVDGKGGRLIEIQAVANEKLDPAVNQAFLDSLVVGPVK